MSLGATGQQLRLRLFLEGIEVPVVSAAVQMGINAPATASIQVIPTDRVTELKPRTMVHLFYWDYNADLPDTHDPPPETVDPNSSLYGYKLLFSGELVGLMMRKAPLGRQAVLQCADVSTYWDTTYQIFISYSPGGNFLHDRSAVWAGGNTMFHNILSGHVAKLGAYLNRQPRTEGLRDVKGLMGGIISLLEAMGGVPKHVSGINDFFTIAELKNHILQQIVAEQNDSTAQRLFASKEFSDWLNQRLTSLGELVSFRDMLKLLFHYIYYEVVPVPAAKFVPAQAPEPAEGTQGLTKAQRTALANAAAIARKYHAGDDTARGTGSPSAALENQTQVHEPEEAARVTQIVDTVVAARNLPNAIRAHLRNVLTHAAGIRSVTTSLPRNAVLTQSGGSRRGERARVVRAYRQNQRQWRLIERLLAGALRTPTPRKERSRTARPQLDRLHSQIFRPDCFFAAPPRCNVLFPEQYTQFQYRRNFLQEITRLRLQTSLEFTGTFLAPIHFAPNLTDIREIAKAQGNRGLRTLLPWEKYTGILPKFEHMAEVNYIANKRQRQVLKNVKGQAASYAQRAANFNFMKYRFAPRSMTVAAKFSPQLVVGFPCLVIDRPFVLDPDAVVAALNDQGLSGQVQGFDFSNLIAHIGPLAQYFSAPTQYLGMAAQVSHNIDQASGSTSVAMTHARTHRFRDDDFLEIFSIEKTRTSYMQTVQTVLDAEELLDRGDYQRLQYLIKATPQNIREQMEERARQGLLSEETEEDDLDVAPGDRPSGAPDLANLDALAPFLLTQPDPAAAVHDSEVNAFFAARDLTPEETGTFGGGTAFAQFRGGTQKNPLKGKRVDILEPSPYGELKPGMRGPQGGVVSQIQLVTDAVLEIRASDIERFLHSTHQRRRAERRRTRQGAPERLYLWRKAIIHEEVKKPLTKPIPIEESIRPPWFSPLYSNVFIGEHIYEPFFGTGSIVDEGLFLTPEGTAFFGTPEERRELLAKLQQADGDTATMAQALEEINRDSLGGMPDVETAVDALAFLYGEVRRQGLDVHQFIADYTRRPIATLKDILGSADLEYRRESDQLVLVAGEPGFHSTAVAPFGELLGLVDNPDLELPRIFKRGKRFPISRELDPRPGRRQKVEEYAREVATGRGALGVGLAG